jgi:2-desacetyl-2-hydroxyethyl bacteriochlorophyllide A dehydrogenase
MNATRVVFPAPRQVALESFDLPDPGPGQLLVRTEKTLISTGTEMTGFTGDFPPDSAWAAYIKYPWIPGYSHAGRVLSVGEGVTDLRPGALVLSSSPHASHALVRRSAATPVPDGVSAEEATFAVLAATVLNGVRRARIELGEAVAVVGAGLIGQLTLQLARLNGAHPLISIDLAQSRLDLAAKLGATHTICKPVDAARDDLLHITRNRGADVAFEVTGHPAVVAPLLKLLRREGRAIMLGSPRGPSLVDFHDEVHTLGLHIIGAHVSTHPSQETYLAPWTRDRHVQLFLDLLHARRFDVTSLITHRYPAPHAADAFHMLAKDRTQALAVLLDWTA